MRDGSGAGCARVSIADHCRHDRACAVGLHAHGPRPSRCAQPQADLDYAWPMAGRSPLRPSPVAPRSPLPRRAYGRPRLCAPMPVAYDAPYQLDAGDKLRVVVYGQEGLTNTYAIERRRHHHHAADRRGAGARPHAGRASPPTIAARLRNGFIREPSVAVEVEAYRPFFILGEVAGPRPISLCAEHDASRARWPLPAASRRAPSATASR